MTNPRRIRVLLADDHPLIRAGVRHRLTAISAVVLVGEATNGAETQALGIQQQPDIVLLDLSMPGPAGRRRCRCCARTVPPRKC
ncbi:MAG: response regulator transcription factor [Chloroflexaceae bacterium]|nr:response regulator transcription factor [Chloroflexaceae bacterium]